MNTVINEQNAKFDQNYEDDETHYVCWCDEDVALCGMNVANRPYTDKEISCVVCAAMDETICSKCGE